MISKCFEKFSKPDLAAVAQDVACYQAEYMAGRYNKYGVYLAIPSVLGNGGIYINNMLALSKMPINFADAQIGADHVLPQPFGMRLALLSPNRKIDILNRLALEKEQLVGFIDHWQQMIQQILSDGLH